MPAKSKKQQRLLGMIHALQNGSLSPKKVSSNVRMLAKNIDSESVTHFAKTKHTDLPEKKEKKEKSDKQSAFMEGFISKCADYGVDAKALLGYYGGSIQNGYTQQSNKSKYNVASKPITPPKPIEPLKPITPIKDTASSLLGYTRFGKYHLNWNGVTNARNAYQRKNELQSKYIPRTENS